MFEKPLGLRENPFLAGHNPKYLFPSREHQEALAHLRYGIQNREPFVLITGEVGTGKTTAVYDALAEWGSRAQVALITNSALTRVELLEEICLRFGVTVPSPMSKPQALVELQRQLSMVRHRGELAILLVDEAQNLDRELLEEIRLLSNLEVNGEYLLQIFLVGQPELESKLAQKELRQLRQRIGIHYRILPLSTAETARYIHHRVAVAGGNAEELFPATTCAEIFRITNGIPREINIVAGQSLLNAFVDDSGSVSVDHVRGVEREIEFQSVLRHEAEAVKSPPPAADAPATPPTATIVPLPTPHAQPEPPRWTPAPPEEYVGHEAMDESETDVEESEAAYGDTRADQDEALVDEFATGDDPIPVERSSSGTSGPPELVLPSWIDEIVARRQSMEARAAVPAPPPPTPWLTPTVPEEPAEVEEPRSNVIEPISRFVPAEPAPPSAAMLAAPPPERIAPHPAEPIPLFDRPGDRDRLPPRLRSKLETQEEEEEEQETTAKDGRPSLAWPIASLVIAAVAIAGLLVVRFGPWSIERRMITPRGTTTPAPDTGIRSGPFPPLEGLGQSPGTLTTTVPIGGQRPAPATGGGVAQGGTEGGGAPAPDGAQTGATLPGSGTKSGGSLTSTAPSPDGAGATPAGSGTPPAPNGQPVFGIATGTFLNENRANAERTRLSESTAMPARVVVIAEDTVNMYRVVIGSFSDRNSAERAASDLVQRGIVTEARVVSVAQPVSARP